MNICSVLLINIKIVAIPLHFCYNVITKDKKGENEMLMIIFVLWVIFALVCAVLVEVYEHEFFGFLFLLSLPLMFYVPFMVGLF